MAHHKRKGPKSTRAGCLLCKPHKRQGRDTPPLSEIRARIGEYEMFVAAIDDLRPWDTDKTSEARVCEDAIGFWPAKARRRYRADLLYLG